jgi:uncharacterized protein (DUF1810 family)
MTHSYHLDRFLKAQAPLHDTVLAELRAGCKRTHWMWFVFPQIAGLGHSAMAQLYAIADLDEARAYLAHPVLGDRLRECTRVVMAIDGKTADDIFGFPDNRKFHSSMTLFALAAGGPSLFQECLLKYFGGGQDLLTVEKLKDQGNLAQQTQ